MKCIVVYVYVFCLFLGAVNGMLSGSSDFPLSHDSYVVFTALKIMFKRCSVYMFSRVILCEQGFAHHFLLEVHKWPWSTQYCYLFCLHTEFWVNETGICILTSCCRDKMSECIVSCIHSHSKTGDWCFKPVWQICGHFRKLQWDCEHNVNCSALGLL